MDAGKASDKSGDGTGSETGSGTMGGRRRGRSGSTQPTRFSARLRSKALPPQVHVFSIAELREIIVGYALQDGEKDFDRRTACTLRLVGKAWNDTVVKILYKNKQPLFKMSAYKRENPVERFYSTFSSSTSINGSIPPFHLDLMMIPDKRALDLCHLLARCGAGLVELKIWFDAVGTPWDIQFPKLSLDRLGKLKITANCNTTATNFVQDGKETGGLRLIKLVLRDATALSELTVSLIYDHHQGNSESNDKSSIFEFIDLPSTISNLSLYGKVKSRDLEILTRRPIPNLTSLYTHLKYDSIADGSLFRFLDAYRTYLKKLSITDSRPLPANKTVIHFPVMEKLDELSIDLLKHDLDNNQPTNLHSLEQSFPKLRALRLHNLTKNTLLQWTGYSKFSSVTSLYLRFLDRGLYVKRLTMETMEIAHRAFPNVRKLDLDMSAMETGAMEYVFREITQLTDLKLNYHGSIPALELNSDYGDALLTGLPLETVAGSSEDPGFWQRSELNGEEPVSSITNLKELRSLGLYDEGCLLVLFGFDTSHLPPFISDISFRLALLKMPKLKTLYLRNRFVASEEMIQEWRSQGRFLVHKQGCQS